MSGDRWCKVHGDSPCWCGAMHVGRIEFAPRMPVGAGDGNTYVVNEQWYVTQIAALTARAEQLEAQVAYHKEKAELINSLEVKAEKVARERAEQELANFGDRISAAIGTNDYLDPPDGGGPELAEQVRRMRTEVVRLKEIAVLSRRFMRANWCTAEYYQLQRELLDKLRAALGGLNG